MNPARELKAARKRAGLSQAAAAQRAGVPQSTFARIELGAIDPRTRTLERLLSACGYSLVVAPQVNQGVDRTQIRRLLELSHEQRLDQAGAAAVNLRSFMAEVKKIVG